MHKHISKLSFNQIFFLTYFVYFLFLFFIKLKALYSGVHSADIFLYTNAIFNVDRLLYSEMLNKLYGYSSILQDHFEPILFLFTPFSKTFFLPEILLFVQTILPPVSLFLLLFGLHKKGLISYKALLITVVFILFNQVFSKVILDVSYGFHHDSLYAPFLCLFIWSVFSKNIWLFMLSIFFLIGIKENAGFYLIGLSFFVFLNWDRKKIMAISMVVLGVFALYFTMVIFPGLFENNNRFVKSFPDILSHEFVASTTEWFFSSDWLYNILLFFPAFFYPPLFLAPALDIGVLFLYKKNVAYWYSFPIFTIWFVAFAFGVDKLITYIPERYKNISGHKSVKILLPLLVILICAILLLKKDAKVEKYKTVNVYDHLVSVRAKTNKDCIIASDFSMMLSVWDYPWLRWPGNNNDDLDYAVVNQQEKQIDKLTDKLNFDDFTKLYGKDGVLVLKHKNSRCEIK